MSGQSTSTESQVVVAAGRATRFGTSGRQQTSMQEVTQRRGTFAPLETLGVFARKVTASLSFKGRPFFLTGNSTHSTADIVRRNTRDQLHDSLIHVDALRKPSSATSLWTREGFSPAESSIPAVRSLPVSAGRVAGGSDAGRPAMRALDDTPRGSQLDTQSNDSAAGGVGDGAWAHSFMPHGHHRSSFLSNNSSRGQSPVRHALDGDASGTSGSEASLGSARREGTRRRRVRRRAASPHTVAAPEMVGLRLSSQRRRRVPGVPLLDLSSIVAEQQPIEWEGQQGYEVEPDARAWLPWGCSTRPELTVESSDDSIEMLEASLTRLRAMPDKRSEAGQVSRQDVQQLNKTMLGMEPEHAQAFNKLWEQHQASRAALAKMEASSTRNMKEILRYVQSLKREFQAERDESELIIEDLQNKNRKDERLASHRINALELRNQALEHALEQHRARPSSHWGSGAVHGSSSYMPPERALPPRRNQ